MTARARITRADLDRATAIAKTEGVSVTITTLSGKAYTITPVLDEKPESDQDQRKPKPWT